MQIDWGQLLIIILGSSVIATLVSKFLDHFTQEREREDERREYLYGPLKFHLIVIGSLDINKKDLMEELKTKREDSKEIYNKEISSLIDKWWSHAGQMMTIIQSHPGYIKPEHDKLIADFIDGWIKRDIIGTNVNKGTGLSSKERMSKLLDAVDGLKKELLK